MICCCEDEESPGIVFFGKFVGFLSKAGRSSCGEFYKLHNTKLPLGQIDVKLVPIGRTGCC